MGVVSARRTREIVRRKERLALGDFEAQRAASLAPSASAAIIDAASSSPSSPLSALVHAAQAIGKTIHARRTCTYTALPSRPAPRYAPRIRRLLPIALLLLAATRCAAREERWFLESPELPQQAKSVVYVLASGNVLLAGFASDAATPAIELPERDDEVDLELYALAFELPLRCLNLTAGPIAFAEVTLPLPLASLVARRSETRFAPAVMLPDAISARLLRTECLELTSTSVVLPDTDGREARVVVALDGATGLVGLDDGRFYVIDSAGAHPADLPRDTPHRAAIRDDDGVIWLIGDDGTVARGDLAGGFQTVTTSSAWRAPIETPEGGGSRVLVDGGGSTGAFEMFAFVPEAGLFQFAGGAWSLIDARTEHHTLTVPGVAWTAPGEGFAVGLAPQEVSVISGGAIVRAELLSGAGEFPEPSYAIDHPRFGALVGARDGSLYARNAGGEWLRSGEATYRRYTQWMFAYRDTILYGGLLGTVAQLLPDGAHCEPVSIAGASIITAAALDDELLATVDGSNGRTVAVYRIRAAGGELVCPGE